MQKTEGLKVSVNYFKYAFLSRINTKAEKLLFFPQVTKPIQLPIQPQSLFVITILAHWDFSLDLSI